MVTSPETSAKVPCTGISPNMPLPSTRTVLCAGSSRYVPGSGAAAGLVLGEGSVMADTPCLYGPSDLIL